MPDIPSLLTPLTGMERMCINADLDTAWICARLAAAGEVTREPGTPHRAEA